MKQILALSLFVLSFNVFANTSEGTAIEVPYPTQQRSFYGPISRVEKEVKKDLMDKAIAVCKTKANIAAIANVEVKVAFDLIEIDNEIFEGGYPLAAASAVVYCRQ